MKGTLSSTRIRPQTYSIRGAGRPAFPPRVSPRAYRTYSVRDSAPISTPYFGSCRRSVTPDGSAPYELPSLTSVDAGILLC